MQRNQKPKVEHQRLGKYCDDAAQIVSTKLAQPVNGYQFEEQYRPRVITILLPLESALFGSQHQSLDSCTLPPTPPCYQQRDLRKINQHLVTQALFFEATYRDNTALDQDGDDPGNGGGNRNQGPPNYGGNHDPDGPSTSARGSGSNTASGSSSNNTQAAPTSSAVDHTAETQEDSDQESRLVIADDPEEGRTLDDGKRSQVSKGQQGLDETRPQEKTEKRKEDQGSKSKEKTVERRTSPRKAIDRKRSPSRSKGSTSSPSPKTKERKQTHQPRSVERKPKKPRSTNPSPHSSQPRGSQDPSTSQKKGNERSSSRATDKSSGRRPKKDDGGTTGQTSQKGAAMPPPNTKPSQPAKTTGKIATAEHGRTVPPRPKGQKKGQPPKLRVTSQTEGMDLDSSGVDISIVDGPEDGIPQEPFYQIGDAFITNTPSRLTEPPKTSLFIDTDFDSLLETARNRKSSQSSAGSETLTPQKTQMSESDHELEMDEEVHIPQKTRMSESDHELEMDEEVHVPQKTRMSESDNELEIDGEALTPQKTQMSESDHELEIDEARKDVLKSMPGKGTVPHCTEEQEKGQARNASTFDINASVGDSRYAVVSSRPDDQPMDTSGPKPALGEIC